MLTVSDATITSCVLCDPSEKNTVRTISSGNNSTCPISQILIFNLQVLLSISCMCACVSISRVYDGNSESATVIGTFCGIGRFPFSIVGTGTDLLLEFVSSAAGER